MAKRVTPAEIIEMNRLYNELNNFAEVARRTGFSASTIRRYVGMGKMPNAHKMAVTQTITVGRK